MWYNLFFQRMEVAFITCTGVGGSRGTEPSMARFANPYEDLQGWKQTDWNSENLCLRGHGSTSIWMCL